MSKGTSCDFAALAWNGVKNKISLGKDPQFLVNFFSCLNGAKEAYSAIRGIIKQLPEVISTGLPAARTEGLFLLSIYFLYSSFVVYDEAKTLEVTVKIYHDKIEALKEETKPFREVIDNVIPRWKKGNTANLEKIANMLLEKIGRPRAVLQDLIQAIRQDIIEHGRNQRWSIFLGSGSAVLFVVCVGSFIVRPTPNVATPPSGVIGDTSSIGVALPICAAASIGAVAYSVLSYISLSDTLPELMRLEKAATTMDQVITRYESELDLAKIRRELYPIKPAGQH